MYSQDIHEELWQNIFMRIFLLSTFLIWTPLILSNPVYIKIDDIRYYADAGRKVSVDECSQDESYVFGAKLNGIIKIDLDKQLATVAVGAINNNEYTHATVWNSPSDIQNYTKVFFKNLEESVEIFEEISYLRGARFKIDRNTLAGKLNSPFILGECRYFDTSEVEVNSIGLSWYTGEIIEEEEYKQLFKTIKLKDDEVTKNFEKRKKEKEDAKKAKKKF